MFITDLKEFHKALEKSGHVTIFCNTDVDALNAFHILAYVLKCEHVTYSMSPVACKDDLLSAISEHSQELKCTVLLNCGAPLNLFEELESIGPDAVFFIVDPARPIDLDNVYDQTQVKIVLRPEEKADLAVPDYADIYAASSSSEDEDEDEEEGDENEEPRSPKRQKRRDPQARAVQIAQKERWKELRQNLLWDYYADCYTSHSV